MAHIQQNVFINRATTKISVAIKPQSMHKFACTVTVTDSAGTLPPHEQYQIHPKDLPTVQPLNLPGKAAHGKHIIVSYTAGGAVAGSKYQLEISIIEDGNLTAKSTVTVTDTVKHGFVNYLLM